MQPRSDESAWPDAIGHRPRSSWRSKFAVAFRGLKLGIHGHSSFFVHFFMTALVLVTAWVLGCELWQWCVLIGCIALVLTTELVNSAIETLFRGLDDEHKQRCWPALDVAAGAVLLASLFAAVMGLLVFGSRILQFWMR
ncbi:MAG: diacylglycerol kinase [Gemmataceae bacterium]